MTRVRRQQPKSQRVPTTSTAIGSTMDAAAVSVAMIQALIPLGLRAVEEALQAEVTALAGARYVHEDGRDGVVRWGTQRGSVFLADQKLAIDVPRVRDQRTAREVEGRTRLFPHPPLHFQLLLRAATQIVLL